ncbi:MAG TPA: O-antigen ligase family protein [Sedimentisphaerales bacterium]|nr:O-antigen ligase family protein [Sedimentisphaerales bacterium]
MIYAVLKRPEIGLLGILIATSSIVFEDQLPLLSLGGISLHIPDLLLLSLLGLIVLRWLVEPEFKIVRTPLDWPLLIFYAVTLLSTFIAILKSSVEAQTALRATRVLSYYLTFFIVTNLVRDRRQLNFLLNSLFLLATIVAAAMIVQFLLGDSVQLLPGRVETLNTQGTMYEDITRILPPGWPIVLVSFVAIFCIQVLEEFKPPGWLKFLQCGLLGMALLVTFLRSYWAVLIMVFFLLAYLCRGYDRRRLIGWGLVVICSAAMILLFVTSDPESRAARLAGASFDRLGTLASSETFQGQDSSLNWRKIENGYAFSTIASHPLIGLGMGFTYRPWDPRLDVPGSNYDFRKHIHNGHLLILLQSGLLGYLGFMWLSLAFLMRGFRYWRSIANDRMRGVVLGFTLVYLAVLIAAWVNSTFMQWRWTPVIGIIMGTNEIILSKVGPEVPVA